MTPKLAEQGGANVAEFDSKLGLEFITLLAIKELVYKF
jgi:hypothetical protein